MGDAPFEKRGDLLVGQMGGLRIIAGPPLTTAEVVESWLKELGEGVVFACQLDEQEREWGRVALQHALLRKQAPRVAHLSLPLQPLLSDRPKRRLVRREEMQLGLLPRLLNTEGWLACLDWVGKEVEKLLKTILLEEAELYTLEGCLKDYLHERESTLLKHHLGRVDQLEEAAAAASDEELVAIERDLLKVRQELLKAVADHNKALIGVEGAIKRSLGDHPELASFGKRMHILAELLRNETSAEPEDWGSCGRELLLLVLFACVGGAACTFQGAPDRLHFALAAALSLERLVDMNGIDAVQELVFQWDTAQDHPLSEEMRAIFFQCWGQLPGDLMCEGGVAADEWLRFLPAKARFPDLFGELKKQPLFDHQGVLTKAAHHFLFKGK